MKTILVDLLYGTVGTLGGRIVSFLANLGGGIGTLVGSLGKLKGISRFRKGLAVLCCAIGQAFYQDHAAQRGLNSKNLSDWIPGTQRRAPI